MSRFNGMPQRQQDKLKKLKWDFEKRHEDAESRMNVDNESVIERQRALIPDSTYAWNVFKLSILWTVASFIGYLLGFMNKDYEGSIYINYYMDFVAGIIGAILGIVLFKYLRMRWSFIIVLSLALFGSIFLLLFQ